MSDPRTPELFALLDDLELEQRLVMMLALSFAFLVLKNDAVWKADIAAITNELAPSPEQHADITLAALKMSGRLREELAD
jgi:hypothetical protein